MRSSESGASLLETTIAMGILATVVGALLGAGLLAVHRFGPDPYQDAIERATSREVHIAADLLKYDGVTLTPRSIVTTVPLPSASPLSVQMSLATTTSADGSIEITVRTVSEQPVRNTTASVVLGHRAPPPGSIVAAPWTVSAPTGAP
ncbi:MAG: hypothetical protein ACYDGM_08030 [Vulcanimicrobiaceae bacterium]